MTEVVHDFKKSLEKSHEHAGAEWWDMIYRNFFPDFVKRESLTTDSALQRAGVDSIVTLKSGRELCIEEKVRSRCYGDILLEYESSHEHRTKGWIEKDNQLTDFLPYVFLPEGSDWPICAYLFPYQSLRLAWIRNRVQWRTLFKPVFAKNKGGYTTVSCPVPNGLLFEALEGAFSIFSRRTASDKPQTGGDDDE